ncbi:hypothetical protein PEPS_47780 (plasmid) [Persicobacter psychrovividus]|uniref:Uncharacterized protein n=1 Tax=Persicobacter psychrovividus TaxID=387638 RepID=A0ABM7VNB0_9BACT|nr:hypothetical protein PEPS_47780 [Persicobacter psychrovividus]
MPANFSTWQLMKHINTYYTGYYSHLWVENEFQGDESAGIHPHKLLR